MTTTAPRSTAVPAASAPEPPAPRPVRVRRRRRRPSGWHLLLAPVALVFAIPFLQMVLASVTPAADIRRVPPPFVPTAIDLTGYVGLFQESDILLWMLNSVIVSIVGIGAHIVLCSLAGYGFARLRFKGRTFGFFAIVGTIMVPTQLLMIPTYIMFSRVGLVDTLGAAMVPWLASAFGVFLMRQFFLSLPKEIEEAALIDGCSRLQSFLRVTLPLAKPAIATLAIFTLLGSWNDLIWPLVAINDESAYTLQLGLANFQGARRTDWSMLMAGNVVATLPLVLFFLFAQRQFIATMTFSGMKG